MNCPVGGDGDAALADGLIIAAIYLLTGGVAVVIVQAFESRWYPAVAIAPTLLVLLAIMLAVFRPRRWLAMLLVPNAGLSLWHLALRSPSLPSSWILGPVLGGLAPIVLWGFAAWKQPASATRRRSPVWFGLIATLAVSGLAAEFAIVYIFGPILLGLVGWFSFARVDPRPIILGLVAICCVGSDILPSFFAD